mmetsp:Transcript_38559/g.28427  ORF Transcript_38559/g.28427 Transcript_38559/m.28427 type:complete len:141 (+) Transcript_38559:1116-1538(+)
MKPQSMLGNKKQVPLSIPKKAAPKVTAEQSKNLLDSIVGDYDDIAPEQLNAIGGVSSAHEAVQDELNKPQALNKFDEMKDKYSVLLRPKVEAIQPKKRSFDQISKPEKINSVNTSYYEANSKMEVVEEEVNQTVYESAVD